MAREDLPKLADFLKERAMKHHPIQWHFIYWILPVLCLLSIFCTLWIGQYAIDVWVISPRGFLENIPSVFLAVAIGYAIATLRHPHLATDPSLKYWIIVFIIACVYFSGEDTNWGQYWFNLDVPNYFLEHNKEKEINLHNMSSWFNQKPRIITDIWAIVACALVPLGWNWPKKATARFIPPILWPHTKDFLFVVFLAILAEVVDKLEDARLVDFGTIFFYIRQSELQEMIVAYLILLYIRDLYKRVKALKPTNA